MNSMRSRIDPDEDEDEETKDESNLNDDWEGNKQKVAEQSIAEPLATEHPDSGTAGSESAKNTRPTVPPKPKRAN